MKTLRLLATLMLIFFTASISIMAQAMDVFEFKVPQQNLAKTLNHIARETKILLLFQYEDVKKIIARELVGTYTPIAALQEVLKGTGLQARTTEKGVITIVVKTPQVERKETSMKNRSKALLWGAAAAPLMIASDVAAQEDEGFALEEIVVTAQKRSQDIQDVPISVEIVPNDRLDAILDGGADIRGLAGRIPSVYVEGSSGRSAPRFYIRGLGNVDFDLQASQPVSIVSDDVVLENVLLKSFPVFDIAQTEVLRGPQGTLFGRNTPAGIIKFDTAKPTQDTEGYISASYGRFDAMRATGALSGGLTDTVSARVAFQFNRRGDYVENLNPNAGFAGNADGKADLENFRDFAVRGHFLFAPSDNFRSLLTLQYRDLVGTTTVFRANVLDKGSNELNNNFDRFSVYYDGGDNNVSEVETFGAILKNELDLDELTITSVTSYYWGDSLGRGDIDGGTGAAFLPTGSTPGFIPFPSDTGSQNTDLSQFTQELRFSSSSDSNLNWQLGGFYFKDEFTADSVSFNGLGGNTPTIRALTTQESEAYSVFGQASFNLDESLTITGGLRYSHDEKTMTGSRPLGFLGPINVNTRVTDSHVSYDLALSWQAADDVTLFTRYANGYRGPSIQGRLLFSNNVSTAGSEVVNSIDVGFKTRLLDNRVRLNGAVFYYKVDNQQHTAIGGTGNLSQLINAEGGRGQGFELDGEFLLTENLLVTAGISYNDTEIQDEGLLVAFCGGGCTVTDPLVDVNGVSRASINGNPFPQAPKWIVTGTAKYTTPVSDAAELFAFIDWTWAGPTNFFLYESQEFNNRGIFELGARLGYRQNENGWELAAFARNLTNAEELIGGIDFNNLTGFVNDPFIWGLELKYEF